MSQSSYSTCSTPMGFWTPVGAGLEDLCITLKRSNNHGWGDPAGNSKLSQFSGIGLGHQMCMDRYPHGLGNIIWGWLLLPVQFLPVAAELLLHPERLWTALSSGNASPPTQFKWDMNNWFASWIINWIFNNESNCLAHSPIDNQANLPLQYVGHTDL